MTDDLFDQPHEIQDKRLAALGDPLVELGRVIDFESFRPLLEVQRKPGSSAAGAPAKDVVMMFKALVIQNLYGLSDQQLEFQLQDRRSFSRFVGLSTHERVPDQKTFWAFRNRLAQQGLMDKLFAQFNAQLDALGYRARKGQIIDASIVTAPIQRNSREDNEKIKRGEEPVDWSENQRRQKDTDARWTKKNAKSYYGYKNHISVDNKNKLIRQCEVSAANEHDSQHFESVLDRCNSSADVWADSAYRSEATEQKLSENGYRSHINRKGQRDRPLNERSQQANRKRSKVRSRVEHVFGAQVDLRKKAIRCVGKVRARAEIVLMNLTYNMRRLCFLQRVDAS